MPFSSYKYRLGGRFRGGLAVMGSTERLPVPLLAPPASQGAEASGGKFAREGAFNKSSFQGQLMRCFLLFIGRD